MDIITSSILYLTLGSILLYFGAEALVSSSSALAIKFKISPLVVGLTIVAFGTSSPELVVSISATLDNYGSIALGNVIGSNICNIALIIGVASIIKPIKVNPALIKKEIPLMILITLVLILFLLDGKISRIDGGILFVGILAYTGVAIYISKRKNRKDKTFDDLAKKSNRKTYIYVIFIIGGIGILVLGANLFLEGAIDMAKFMGAPRAVIGLSVVAFGTSLPELATSVVASFKGEGDICIGNAIGSNVFNILLVLGTASFIKPMLTGDINLVDFGVLLFISVVILPLAYSGGLRISRLNGAFLLILYIVYVYYLYSLIP